MWGGGEGSGRLVCVGVFVVSWAGFGKGRRG